jgi:hypothetical protein
VLPIESEATKWYEWVSLRIRLGRAVTVRQVLAGGPPPFGTRRGRPQVAFFGSRQEPAEPTQGEG